MRHAFYFRHFGFNQIIAIGEFGQVIFLAPIVGIAIGNGDNFIAFKTQIFGADVLDLLVNNIGPDYEKRGNRKLQYQHRISEPNTAFASAEIAFQDF